MNSKELQIVERFLRHIETNGGNCAQWFIGVTSDFRMRLFLNHNVGNENCWTYEHAETNAAAETIAKYFVGKHKLQGGYGDGSEGSVFVYLYKITSRTIQ